MVFPNKLPVFKSTGKASGDLLNKRKRVVLKRYINNPFSDSAEKHIAPPPPPLIKRRPTQLRSVRKKKSINNDIMNVTFTLGNKSFTRMMTCNSPSKYPGSPSKKSQIKSIKSDSNEFQSDGSGEDDVKIE